MNLTLEIQLIYSGFSIVSLFSSLLARLQVWSSFYYMFRLPPSSFRNLFFSPFLEQINNLFTLYIFFLPLRIFLHMVWVVVISCVAYRSDFFPAFFTLPSTVNNPLLSLQFFFSLFIHSRRLMRCPERFKSLLADFFFLALPPPELFSHGKRNSLFGISSRRLIGPSDIISANILCDLNE